MVMIPAFQAGGPGSIPGRRILETFACMELSAPDQAQSLDLASYRGVVVITSA